MFFIEKLPQNLFIFHLIKLLGISFDTWQEKEGTLFFRKDEILGFKIWIRIFFLLELVRIDHRLYRSRLLPDQTFHREEQRRAPRLPGGNHAGIRNFKLNMYK